MPFIDPLTSDRFLVASLFARRICRGEATEAETEFMNRYMDLEIDDLLLDGHDVTWNVLREFQLDNFRDG